MADETGRVGGGRVCSAVGHPIGKGRESEVAGQIEEWFRQFPRAKRRKSETGSEPPTK